MQKPTIHLIGCFHTVNNLDYSHCAFTGKVLRFPKMMKMAGYTVIDYSNGESKSEADEKVQILTEGRLDYLKKCWLASVGKFKDSLLKGDKLHYAKVELANKFVKTGHGSVTEQFHGDTAAIGSPHHAEFEAKLIEELKTRIKPGDIIAHPFGRSHASLTNSFPTKYYAHVETGIGYPDAPFGAFRIFETNSWQSVHHGKWGQGNEDYEFVIPNYYDLNDWTPRIYTPNTGYILFFNRICVEKGMNVVVALANALQEKILVAGQGDVTPWSELSPYIQHIGAIKGAARNELLQNARCLLMPTRFHEPFGGSGVEGQLVGTPLVSSDGAAFSETVVQDVTGFRCKTLKHWVEACSSAHDANSVYGLDRTTIAKLARKKYSLETCAEQYDAAFSQIVDLYNGSQGWYKL